ncbi:zinc-binding alcohol dehydrogenase family protein [Paenibacillus zeisoli]|uniref:Zinc-binding alcohol dehydrogenase family protein n=1 Tax=Paenibacillus zeisoli TaxID=2496267 RepID=A0A3S1JMC4_9BACL|nr:zinc-binding alcohol dehydrogenase family protein [Paenibacillus zeisoli]
MKAAIVKEMGATLVFGQCDSPVATEGHVLVNVSTAALSRLSKFRSMGMHYSSEVNFPLIAGADGVGTLEDGTRVYFAQPTAPYGSLAEQTLVKETMIVPLPDGLDDITAAAIANPATSSWAALVYRAHFKPGQTVLINGATGASGSLAVQIAKYLGAMKIIVTGRNESKLRLLGADEVVAFDMSVKDGSNEFENALMPAVAGGVDVVLDYLWGDSAVAIMSAIAKTGTKQTTRFVSIGTSSGQETINVPSSILRASSIELLGSGGRSVSLADMMSSAKSVFEMAAEGKINIAVAEFALQDIEAAWHAPLTPRPVVRV